MRSGLVYVAFIALLVGGCATSGGSGPGSRDRNLITQQEVEASAQNNALDLVRVLRPAWLQVRGLNSIRNNAPISVYVDGIRYGDPDSLRSIPRLTIESIRYYNAADAQAKFGLNNTNGVIAVRTRRG